MCSICCTYVAGCFSNSENGTLVDASLQDNKIVWQENTWKGSGYRDTGKVWWYEYYDVCIPKIKYKLEGEDEKCCQFLPSNLKSGEENNIYLYPKQYHIDDKVTILYDKGKANDMFVLPRMQLMRLLVNQFVPGCFFILAAILGLCFVF